MSPEKITLNELILCTLNACLHQDPNRIGAGEGSPVENYFLHFLLFNLLPPPYWPMRAPHSSWRNSSKPSTETFSPFSSQTYQVPTVGPSLLSQWRHVQLLLKDIVPQTPSFHHPTPEPFSLMIITWQMHIPLHFPKNVYTYFFLAVTLWGW